MNKTVEKLKQLCYTECVEIESIEVGDLRITLTKVIITDCVALASLVLIQEGKSAGLGSIGGLSETYWGKK